MLATGQTGSVARLGPKANRTGRSVVRSSKQRPLPPANPRKSDLARQRASNRAADWYHPAGTAPRQIARDIVVMVLHGLAAPSPRSGMGVRTTGTA